MGQAHGGRTAIQRIVNLDSFVLALDFLFRDATLTTLTDWRDTLAGTHVDWEKDAGLLAVPVRFRSSARNGRTRSAMTGRRRWQRDAVCPRALLSRTCA